FRRELAAVLRELRLEEVDVEAVVARLVEDGELSVLALHLVAAELRLLADERLARELRGVAGDAARRLPRRLGRRAGGAEHERNTARLDLGLEHEATGRLVASLDRGVEHGERLHRRDAHGVRALRGLVGAGPLDELVLDL